MGAKELLPLISTGVFLVAAVVGWILVGVRRVSSSAFMKGEHMAEHKELRTDINSAHDKIRVLDKRVDGVDATQAMIIGKLDLLIRYIVPTSGERKEQ